MTGGPYRDGSDDHPAPVNSGGRGRFEPADLSDLRRIIVEREQDLLGGVLMRSDLLRVAFDRLGEAPFLDRTHQAIWTAICEAARAGLPTSATTIARRLPTMDVGGLNTAQYLARLYSATTLTVAEADGSLDWLQKLWANHALVERLDEARDAALNPAAEPRAVTSRLLGDIDVIRAGLERGKRRDRAMLGEFADDFMAELRGRLDGSVENPAIMTGLRDLDEVLGGILPETLMVIAGRPGMGKTVGATTIAMRAANQGRRVAFFSLEMGYRQMIPRCLSFTLYGGMHQVPYQEIIRADPRRIDLAAIERATGALKALPLYLDVIPSPTVAEITSRSRSAVDALGGPLDLIVVDYLGLMSAGARYAGSKVNETAEISGGLKALTNSTGTPIVLVCQLSRQVETRTDKRPQLSDLRDSGAIEQDADVVIFPFREEYYLDDKDEKDAQRLLIVRNTVEMIVAKNRHGATEDVRLFADVAHSIFDNLAQR